MTFFHVTARALQTSEHEQHLLMLIQFELTKTTTITTCTTKRQNNRYKQIKAIRKILLNFKKHSRTENDACESNTTKPNQKLNSRSK